MTPSFQLLRTKTDEATEDADWVGENTIPSEGIRAEMRGGTASSGYFQGIEVIVVGVNADGVPVDRAAMTVTLTLVAILSRGGTAEDVVYDTAEQTAVPLQTPCYFPFNGGSFTIRVTDNGGIAGVASLQIWYRPTRWAAP